LNSSRVFIAWQMRFKAPLYQPVFTFLEFGLQQRFEITQMRATLAQRLVRQWGALRGDGRQMQHLAPLADGGRFQRRALRQYQLPSGGGCPVAACL
jgi:hypothetical protein